MRKLPPDLQDSGNLTLTFISSFIVISLIVPQMALAQRYFRQCRPCLTLEWLPDHGYAIPFESFTISPTDRDFQLNGLILHTVTGTSTITLFLLAIIIELTNLAAVLFIVPESLPPSRRLSRVPSSVDHQSPSPQRRKGMIRHILRTIRDVTTQFLRPAALFIPLKLEARRVRDWNLTLTGAALFLYVFADVSRINVYDAYSDIHYLASL